MARTEDWPLNPAETEALKILIDYNQRGVIDDAEFEARLLDVLGRDKEQELWEWSIRNVPRWFRLYYWIKNRLGKG